MALIETTQCCIAEGCHLHTRHHENLKSHIKCSLDVRNKKSMLSFAGRTLLKAATFVTKKENNIKLMSVTLN
jgi:hypothetical protein